MQDTPSHSHTSNPYTNNTAIIINNATSTSSTKNLNNNIDVLNNNEVEAPSILKNNNNYYYNLLGGNQNILVASPYKYPFANVTTTTAPVGTLGTSGMKSILSNNNVSMTKQLQEQQYMNKNLENNNNNHDASPNTNSTSGGIDMEIDKRQKLINTLFPKAATVQDTTGIKGIKLQSGFANI